MPFYVAIYIGFKKGSSIAIQRMRKELMKNQNYVNENWLRCATESSPDKYKSHVSPEGAELRDVEFYNPDEKFSASMNGDNNKREWKRFGRFFFHQFLWMAKVERHCRCTFTHTSYTLTITKAVTPQCNKEIFKAKTHRVCTFSIAIERVSVLVMFIFRFFSYVFFTPLKWSWGCQDSSSPNTISPGNCRLQVPIHHLQQ